MKLIVAILMMTAVPVFAQAQKPSTAKLKADAQNVVKIISSDKAKTQTYCDMGKLGAEMDEADQNKDTKKLEELSQKMDEMVKQLGPEYGALSEALQDVDPESEDGQAIDSALEALDKLCAK